MLEQLVGEWIVGVGVKTSNGKLVSGCGTLTPKENTSPTGRKLRDGYEYLKVR